MSLYDKSLFSAETWYSILLENVRSLGLFCEQLKNDSNHTFFSALELQICQNIEYSIALFNIAGIFPGSLPFCINLARLLSSWLIKHARQFPHILFGKTSMYLKYLIKPILVLKYFFIFSCHWSSRNSTFRPNNTNT